MKIDQALLTALIGLIAGTVGSLIAPWVNWGIEKRRLRLLNRKEMINKLKLLISEEQLDREKIVNSTEYHQLKEHLSTKSIKILESSEFVIYLRMGADPIDHERKEILEDISKLEKKWRLV